MEPKELSPDLLQPQVTVVATLGELLDTLHRRDEEVMMLECPGLLHKDLEEFTEELRVTLHGIENTPRRHIVPNHDDGGVTSLSQALAAYGSTPQTTRGCVAMAASEWQWSVSVLVYSWAKLSRKATELCDTWSKVASEAMTTRARELQAEAAHDGTALERMGELGQALGGEEGVEVVTRTESSVRRRARVAASEATTTTMEREQLEPALGPLERLVAACRKATTFPQVLQSVLRDTETALKGTKKSPDVPEDLVAKVAEAERLWEANAHLAKEHLVGIADDLIRSYSKSGPTSPSACGVPKRCQRAMEDIPRLLRLPERPQDVPEESLVSTELKKMSPALLQPQVTVVATLGELLDTLPTQEEEEMLLECPKHLRRDLEEFTKELRATLHYIDDTWRCHKVTSGDYGMPTFLTQALAALRSILWTTQDHVTMAAPKWHHSVSVLVDRWARLTGKATKLRDTCRMATEAMTTRVRELQAKAARDGTSEEQMVELVQALGREEGAEVVAGHDVWVRREAMVAASEATRAIMVTQRMWAALGLLQCLMSACDKATAFPRELQYLLRVIEAALKGTKKKSHNIPMDLVAVAERMWEANACLAKDHLLGTIDDFLDFYSKGGCARPSAREVAKRCQRAIEDIPRLLQHSERPQGVPKVSPVSMELQKLSPALLQPQVTVVATLGELLDTLPMQEEEMLLESSKRLHRDMEEFTEELWFTLHRIDDTWRHHIATDDDVTFLSWALAAYTSTPGTTQDRVAMAARKWQWSVNVLVDSWGQVARKATKLRDTCRMVVTEAVRAELRERQAKAARDGTAQEHMMELGQALGGEEGAKMVAGRESPVREEARVVASEATMATMVRERVEAALGPLQRLVAACDEATAFPRELQRLVAACDEATAFPRELQRLLRDTKIALKGTKKKFPTVPEDLAAKVARAKQLWAANVRLAKDHLLGIIEDFLDFYSKGGRVRPSAHEVAERCQRATEDIPNLLQG